MAGLTLKNINKEYENGFKAVKDFNLDIADKEFIVFVGPSGCGKSTTLRMIAGLEEISSGELYIDENVVNDLPSKDRDIAMGRAIVRNPKVFLMDEPLSNLDAKLRVQMRIEIAKLHKDLNTTFIYVTHDQTEAMTLGTRIVVMKDGIVQQVATPKEIYNNPANLFVAGFIGSPQMNMFYGETTLKGGKVYLKTLGQEFELSKEQSEKIINAKKESCEVILGIRPENISCNIDDLNAATQAKFKTTVDVRENLGAETYVYTKIEDRNFIIKTKTDDALERNEDIEYVFDVNKIHVFDKEEQYTIL